MADYKVVPQKTTGAYIGASWASLLIAVTLYFVGLYNADMELNDKGYYFAILFFGLFAVVSIQKTIRDRAEGIPTSNIYYGLAWVTVLVDLLLLGVGLWNADMDMYQKGFYGATMMWSLFSGISVQKNVRDVAAFDAVEKSEEPKRKPVAAGHGTPPAAVNHAVRPHSNPDARPERMI